MTDINREIKNENETEKTKEQIKDEKKNETKNENETKNDNIDTIDSKTIKQLKNTVEVFNIIRDLSSHLTSDPFKKAMEERIQKSIIENIESFPIVDNKLSIEALRQKENIEPYKDTDVPIYEKLSSGDVYIIRIIDNELEVIENCDGDVVYKRVKLSS